MFKNLLTVVGLMVLAACGVDSSAKVGNDQFAPELEVAEGELSSSKVSAWFPMGEGNEWVLQTASGQTRTVTFSDLADSVAWLDGMVPNGRWAGVASSAPNTLYTWDESGNRWDAFLRFGYAVSSWQWGSGACGTFTAKRSATGRKVETAAGTFTDTRSIEFVLKPSPTARCVAPSFSEFTFAANVGLVQIKTPAGEQFDLVSAKVGTKRWPLPSAGPVSKLSTDKAVYTSKGNTIVCITTPCPSNEEPAVAKLTYTLTNTTSTTRTWQFSSSCQTNTLVYDSKGDVVKNFEIARLCLASLTHVTLAPGQSKTYTEELTLTGDSGQLLQGDYTAKMVLTPRDNSPALPATAKFHVDVL